VNLITKLLSGDVYRKTRAHSEKGTFGLRSARDIADAARSFGGHILRVATGRLPKLPWLTYGAIRFLKHNLPRDARVFEFGGGMSTLWFDENCAEVHTVEDNPVWHQDLARKVRRAKLYHYRDSRFISVIHQFPPAYFDLIVVDGNFDRHQCFDEAEQHLKPGGVIVIDDSDKGQIMGGPIRELDEWLVGTHNYQIQRFVGWIPGCFWVKETTIAKRA
jgi:hypothetical protein